MKSIISKSIVVAFASAATLATQAFAQTYNITGTATVAAPKQFSGSAFTNSVLQSPVTIAATVTEESSQTFKTNSKGDITTTTKADKFAYGNKEILADTLGISNVSGFSLALTNRATNTAGPLNVGGLAAVNTKTLQASNVTIATIDDVELAQTASTLTVLSNGTTTVNKQSGIANIDTTIDGYFANAVGPYTADFEGKLITSFGTTRTTNEYTINTFNGRINTVD